MKPWLLVASAALALFVIARRSGLLQLGDSSSESPPDDANASDNTEPDWIDQAGLIAQEVKNAVIPTPVSDMQVSDAGRQLLKQFESLALTPYRLGDGGWTLGWGRYYPDSGTPPPASIDRATADAWFDEDVEQRGARWVRAYVTVPLTQSQFDALVSMAYNLSPKSFKTIADAVNAGEDPEAAALRFVRAGSNLERGLRRRRGLELALYRSDSANA